MPREQCGERPRVVRRVESRLEIEQEVQDARRLRRPAARLDEGPDVSAERERADVIADAGREVRDGDRGVQRVLEPGHAGHLAGGGSARVEEHHHLLVVLLPDTRSRSVAAIGRSPSS